MSTPDSAINPDSIGVKPVSLDSCRVWLNYVTFKMMCPPFSHLTTTGIAGGANEKNTHPLEYTRI
jgi:hypothetical protein